jgi:hypothetical protein
VVGVLHPELAGFEGGKPVGGLAPPVERLVVIGEIDRLRRQVLRVRRGVRGGFVHGLGAPARVHRADRRGRLRLEETLEKAVGPPHGLARIRDDLVGELGRELDVTALPVLLQGDRHRRSLLWLQDRNGTLAQRQSPFSAPARLIAHAGCIRA